MKENQEEDLFLARSKQLLDQGAEETDVDVLRQLRIARFRALTEPPSKSFGWATATGLATLCLVVLVFFLTREDPVQKNLMADFDDIELLASSESFEFYDDLEFYGWLVEEQGAG